MIFLYIFLFIIFLVVIAQSRIMLLEHFAKQGNSEAMVNLGTHYTEAVKDYKKGLCLLVMFPVVPIGVSTLKSFSNTEG